MTAAALGRLSGASTLHGARLAAGRRGASHGVVVAPKEPKPFEPAAKPVRLPSLQGASPETITQLVEALVILFLVDDSGSMYGTWGDGSGVRYAAARSLVDLVRRHAKDARAGVVHWGTDVGDVLPPVPVRRGGRQLQHALRIPPSLGGNNLPAALARAAGLLPAATAGSEVPLVFVLTDGCEPITPAMHAALGALPPGCVHIALVDRSNALDPFSEAAWRALPLGSFTRLDLDTSGLATELGALLARALGLTLPTAPTITS